MTYKEEVCIDAGSENCPCLLAESGDCITCSRLQGKDCCDCNWRGVCIYNEYIQNGKKINNRRESKKTRILKKIWYGEDLVVLVVEVSKGFALKASLPGSYVFLKRCHESDCYSVPISVMRAEPEKGQLHLAVKVVAGKTKALAEATDHIEIRGVYRNGLLGVSRLLTKQPQKVLCITKGVGFAPAANYNQWAFGKDTIDMIIDLDKINQELVNDYLVDYPANSIRYTELTPDLVCPEEYDRVLILASDYFVESIAVPEKKRIVSNNFHMCCGEGICGACTMVDDQGKSHKMCKCQFYEF
ncbi:hypothetical protein NIA71_09795 [Ihubacter massiliensis]|uniref:NAD(P)H-flavin reductase n=1 Tax=Hominibacterium faecale TaxID=2839743 RepID=A0A9J6QX91_9FIRM|nr:MULTISPECIES: hypothetical protein [Eubacteriales Family XIII. Incertae Sedis]MCO7122233.1 hypothetical protein [Ihubacter massiliensis]MCU7380105.1 hypothetical protein [Hominibacterium faecale]